MSIMNKTVWYFIKGNLQITEWNFKLKCDTWEDLSQENISDVTGVLKQISFDFILHNTTAGFEDKIVVEKQ